MCNVSENIFENETKNIEKDENLLGKCNKCRSARSCVILRNKDAYCKSCFLIGTTHKFKSILGKSRLIRPNDKILVLYECGHPSTALLNLLRTNLDLTTSKKLQFVPIVLFVEDNYDQSLEERRNILKIVEEEVTLFQFKLYYISFVEYILRSDNLQSLICCENFQVYENDKEKLLTVLNSKTTKTYVNELMRIFKRQLLVDTAKSLKCKFVFSPEISLDTASNLLTNIALGRGCHVPIDTGFCDDRDEVKILRPLRLFDIKELTFYNKFNNLHPVPIRKTEGNSYSSVQELMNKFVKDLQLNFPATVTTIMRTGDKLSMDANDGKICKFCKGMLPKKSDELTSEESTNFSHLVSTETPDYKISMQERFQNIMEKFSSEDFNSIDYCYACSKVVPYIST